MARERSQQGVGWWKGDWQLDSEPAPLKMEYATGIWGDYICYTQRAHSVLQPRWEGRLNSRDVAPGPWYQRVSEPK